MKLFQISRTRTIYLGIGWSLIYSTILLNMSQIQSWELKVRDSLIRLRGSRTELPKDIKLVVIDQSPESQSRSLNGQKALNAQKALSGQEIATNFKLSTDPQVYANVVETLIDAGAKGVLLNLPNAFTANFNQPEANIQRLVEKYQNQIVLTSYPYSGDGEIPVLPIYNKFLPPSEVFGTVQGNFICRQHTTTSARSSVDARTVFGFFEFDPILGRADNSEPLIQRIYSAQRKFQRSDCIEGEAQEFNSAVFLAYQKFSGRPYPRWARSSIQMNFWSQPGRELPKLQIRDICPSLARNCQLISDAEQQRLRQQVQDKIILIGLRGFEPNSFPMRSPFGNLQAVELQANLLASMMTDSFYYPLDRWYTLGIILIGAALISSLLYLGMAKPSKWYLKWTPLMILTGIQLYAGLFLIAFEFKYFLPIVLPTIAWIGTGISVAISLFIRQRQERFMEQTQRLVEREAVLSQTRKLLSRVATDIHDGPLQELKLVMDRLEELELTLDPELLLLNQRNSRSEPIIDVLIRIGRGIRDQLNDMQTIAQKQQNVSSELSAGLVPGIQSRLQVLTETGELRLKVIQDLKFLKEPRLDETWIDAREDIFRFFKEAINNVIRHAQPPYGTATYVEIALKQQDNRCTLMIKNDGVRLENVETHTPALSRSVRGQGTKLMTTLAADLPDGSWNRELLDDGGVCVTLSWTLPSSPSEFAR